MHDRHCQIREVMNWPLAFGLTKVTRRNSTHWINSCLPPNMSLPRLWPTLETVFLISIDLTGHQSQPSGAGAWCLFDSSRGVVGRFRYLQGLRSRIHSGRKKGRSAQINVPVKIWIWKCTVIQGLNNSARPWCLLPLLFHRLRQPEFLSHFLGLESRRQQRKTAIL